MAGFPSDEDDKTIQVGGDQTVQVGSKPELTRRFQWSPDREDLEGKSLGGYVLQRHLGTGASAEVYQGRDDARAREVAVKVLLKSLTKRHANVEAFVREARLLMRFQHPNIVDVHDVGHEEDHYFMVMELVGGGDLLEVLRSRQRLSPADAKQYVREIAAGLQEAHSKGIVHRDVKPSNVLLCDDGSLKLTDFGLAMLDGDQGFGVKGVVGTPHYMSPEQVDAKEVDPRTDVYALGATFYHLLTGETPYEAKEPWELLLQHVSGELIPPHQRAPGVPQDLSWVVCRMMAKAPEARFQNMGQVLEALEDPGSVSAEAPAVSAPVSEPETLLAEEPVSLEAQLGASARWPRWVPLVSAAALLLSLGAGIAFTMVLRGPTAYAAAEPASERAARRLLAELDERLTGLEPERAAGLLRRFAAVHAGTRAGALASARAASLTLGGDPLSRAQAHADAGRLGQALDALVELDGRRLEEDEEAAALALREELGARLEALGLTWVPPGEWRAGDEGDVVFTRGVYIGLREVTRGEYAAWARESGARLPWSELDPAQAELPASGLTAEEASAYAASLGARLPTWQEWEKAARGAAGQAWPWGKDPAPARFNWAETAGAPRPPGSFPEDVSPYGCLDMAGNVAELTVDRQPGGGVRVKGGAWATRTAANARPAFALEVPADAQHEAVGFRLAWDDPPEGGR